jgi:hypothetical protein
MPVRVPIGPGKGKLQEIAHRKRPSPGGNKRPPDLALNPANAVFCSNNGHLALSIGARRLTDWSPIARAKRGAGSQVQKPRA